MLLIRRFEERAGQQYAKNKVGGFLHLAIGEEATIVGAVRARRDEDYLISTYRSHGHALARGANPDNVMAELFGREDGTARGRGGSMHIFDGERRFMGGYGIVGGNLPLAAGFGLAADYMGNDDVTVCVFGDGASNQGTFGETLNLAALWKLPIVFICENNEYAMGTPLSRTLSVHDVSQKALGYGMARDRFDVEDVLQVRDRLGEAIERARTLSEPTLVEIRTYRFRGHSMSDPAKYRTAEELEERKKKDAVLRSRTQLTDKGLTQQIEKIEAEVEEVVADCVRFADESPEPGPELLEPTTYAGAFAR